MPEEWTITIIRDTNSVYQNSTLDIFLFSSLPQNIPQANYIFLYFVTHRIYLFLIVISANRSIEKESHSSKKDRKSRDKECNSTRRARVGQKQRNYC
jgi:hypothetical protein